MSHGIDVCRCGAVVRQCRCIGPHTKRVACETCDVCRKKPAPTLPPPKAMTTPAPALSALVRGLVEALRDGARHLQWWVDICGGDWRKSAIESAAKLDAMRAALAAFEKRPRLRDVSELRELVDVWVHSGSGEGDDILALLDAVEAALGLGAGPREPAKACKRCSECADAEHHWIDNDECNGPGDPTHACKHCDAVGDECETCGGEGGRYSEDGHYLGGCPACKSHGVIVRGAGPRTGGEPGEETSE